MSSDLSPSDFVKQSINEINLDKKVKIRLMEGAQFTQKYTYIADSPSSTSINFNNVNPSSKDVLMDRNVVINNAFRLTFQGTGVAAGEFLFQTDGRGLPPASGKAWAGSLTGGTDSLRAFPMMNAMQNITISINGFSFSQNINEYLNALLRYIDNRDLLEEDLSGTPTMLDQYINYSDFQTYGSAKNVHGNYGENGYRTPRGGFAGLNVVNQFLVGNPDGTPSTGVGDTMVAEVDIFVSEPMMLSPFQFSKASERAFVGIKTMKVTLNYDSEYAKYMWSHDETTSGKTINSIKLTYDTVTENFPSTPQLICTYYELKTDTPVPKINLYQYNNIHTEDNVNSSAVGPTLSQTINSDSIQLDSVPKRIYIFAERRRSDKTINNTDTYARIKSINLNFGTSSGMLSDATEYALYKMSVDNGLKTSWSQWQKFTGSVLCIDFAKDIGLKEGIIPGTTGTFRLSYKIVVQNLSTTESIAFNIKTAIVDDGVVIIDGDSLRAYESFGNTEGLLDNPSVKSVDYALGDSFVGAGFKEDIKNAAKHLGKKGLDLAVNTGKAWAPEIAGYLTSLIPIVGPEAAPFVRTAISKIKGGQMSKSEAVKMCEMVESMMKGGNFVGGDFVGGDFVGGKKMSKKSKTGQRYLKY